jgi:predicted ribosomally synthesized peptide with SipW-like signal peptide
MKLTKKKLLVISLAVCLLAILSFSTLAWFSDADSVTNDFQVGGGANQDPDEIFSLDVMEKVDVNGDGIYDLEHDMIVGKDKDPNYTDKFLYENIMPGDMLYKSPSAQNTGANDQYVRFKVTISNANEWVAIMQKYGMELHDLLYMADKTTKLTASPNWTFVPGDTTVVDNKITYVFYYNQVLESNQSAILFTYVNIPYQLTQHDMALFTDGQFQMVVTGEAIQVKNINATNAKDAFAIVESTQAIA